LSAFEWKIDENAIQLDIKVGPDGSGDNFVCLLMF